MLQPAKSPSNQLTIDSIFPKASGQYGVSSLLSSQKPSSTFSLINGSILQIPDPVGSLSSKTPLNTLSLTPNSSPLSTDFNLSQARINLGLSPIPNTSAEPISITRLSDIQSTNIKGSNPPVPPKATSYYHYLDKTMLSEDEAVCMLCSRDPQPIDKMHLVPDEKRVRGLIHDGINNKKLVNVKKDPHQSGRFLIPTKALLKYAQGLNSVKLDPKLIEQASLLKPKPSYRPAVEGELQAAFNMAARFIMTIWPMASLKDICNCTLVKDLFQDAQPIATTLRKWLKQGKIKLYASRKPKSNIEFGKTTYPTLWSDHPSQMISKKVHSKKSSPSVKKRN